jgi:predicted ABC-type ATPase
MHQLLESRPIIVALAGPNGAGKTTFYHAFLAAAGLRFLNADEIARELGLGPYEAAKIVEALRDELVRQRESFVFETVFSDPVGDKVGFLKRAILAGYTVVLCYIGISGPEVSETRVAMRVSQGGHDVPPEKIKNRFPRTLANLRAAIGALPHVLVYDNDNLAKPYQKIAEFHHGVRSLHRNPPPHWFPHRARGRRKAAT